MKNTKVETNELLVHGLSESITVTGAASSGFVEIFGY